MPDLEIGEKVEFIKTPGDDKFAVDVVGYTGIVDRRVSGGYAIKVKFMMGSLDVIVGSVDWNVYVKKIVIKDPIPSPVPQTLRKWYTDTLKTVKNG